MHGVTRGGHDIVTKQQEQQQQKGMYMHIGE